MDWKIFEKINEFFYVTDIDSREIVYMNEASRRELKVEENYQGKKCFSILYGFATPCTFCNQKQLCENGFYKCSHTNPIMKKTLFIQSTLLEKDGHRYRLELAKEYEKNQLTEKDSSSYAANEIILNECLQYALKEDDYENVLNRMISYIGERFCGARVYIFQINSNATVSNTYEWCREGIVPQKELLQNEPLSTVEFWMQVFENNQMVVIEDLETIKYSMPLVYAALKPQDVHALVTCPLKKDGKIVGFFGIDNPEIEQISAIISFFRIMEYFIVSFLKKKELFSRTEYISFHDQLTGALNRSAYNRDEKEMRSFLSLGVLYGDITGLKRVNDRSGHCVGDTLICRCYELLRQIFAEEHIYRIGGDEFLVFVPEIDKEEFEEKCSQLRLLIEQSECNMAVGCSWGNPKADLSALQKQAEEEMYREKREYYKNMSQVSSELSRHGELLPLDLRSMDREQQPVETIEQYLAQHPEYVRFVIDSISSFDSTVSLYLGDLSSNVFYISENLKHVLGFSGDVVINLQDKWENLICYPEDRELFRRDFENMKAGLQDRHDLKYRIYDKEGNQIWAHSVGKFQWNAERTRPVFLAGCVTRQEFLIDPITFLPKEDAALHMIRSIKDQGKNCVIFGVGINYFSEINELKGRDMTDKLLQDITQNWSRNLSSKVRFYRLNGVKFMAVKNPDCTDSVESIVSQIRKTVRYSCNSFHVLMKFLCSICIMDSPPEEILEDDVIEKIVSCIDIAKQHFEKEYICCTPDTLSMSKSQAEYLLNLNRDVVSQFRNFRIVIQPIVSVGTEKIVGGEVLLRWKCGEQNISPMVFIPLLEKRGLICQVGRWVVEETVRNCQRIIKSNPEFQLSFNVSYLQISDEGFTDFIEQTLKKYGISGSNLIMELTESHFDSDPKKLMKLISGCEKLGMFIALDDFGSGYSSLSRLLKYPAGLVKLDRSLICELMGSEERKKFLKAIVYACHQFNKLVCVEGVETAESVKIVSDAGCDRIQGYYYYRPLELLDFYDVLNKENEKELQTKNEREKRRMENGTQAAYRDCEE